MPQPFAIRVDYYATLITDATLLMIRLMLYAEFATYITSHYYDATIISLRLHADYAIIRYESIHDAATLRYAIHAYMMALSIVIY